MGRKGIAIQRVLDALRDSSGPPAVGVGVVPPGALDFWPRRAFDSIVITRRQRAHYLTEHPEMIDFEEELVRTILDPDEVHTSKRGALTAVFFRRHDEAHDIVAVVSISEQSELTNSVITARRQRSRRRMRPSEAGRKVWER